MGIYWEGKEEDYRQAVTMVLRQKLRGHSLKVLFDKEKKLKERMFPNPVSYTHLASTLAKRNDIKAWYHKHFRYT